jgi:hypothetical protein
MPEDLADPGRREPTGLCELTDRGAGAEGLDHRRFAFTQALVHPSTRLSQLGADASQLLQHGPGISHDPHNTSALVLETEQAYRGDVTKLGTRVTVERHGTDARPQNRIEKWGREDVQ